MVTWTLPWTKSVSACRPDGSGRELPGCAVQAEPAAAAPHHPAGVPAGPAAPPQRRAPCPVGHRAQLERAAFRVPAARRSGRHPGRHLGGHCWLERKEGRCAPALIVLYLVHNTVWTKYNGTHPLKVQECRKFKWLEGREGVVLAAEGAAVCCVQGQQRRGQGGQAQRRSPRCAQHAWLTASGRSAMLLAMLVQHLLLYRMSRRPRRMARAGVRSKNVCLSFSSGTAG